MCVCLSGGKWESVGPLVPGDQQAPVTQVPQEIRGGAGIVVWWVKLLPEAWCLL